MLGKGFKVEDITFRGMRKQSEIEEMVYERNTSEGVIVPTSFTPEQVKDFLRAKSENVRSEKEKSLYKHLIDILDLFLESRIKINVLENEIEKLNRRLGENETS